MQTIHKLTFGLINDRLNLTMLAGWECMIGLLLIVGKCVKPALAFLFLHMVFTFTLFILFPSEVFRQAPYGLTMTGQYIMKNIVFIAAGLVLWRVEQEKARGKKCDRL